MRVVDILNYIPYNRAAAIQELKREVGFEEYGNKHYESRFTKFFQGYFLPVKFGFDKRRAHLSSMILSGQITREAALEELAKEVYESASLAEDKEYVLKKLCLSEEEFEAILRSANKSFRDYPTSDSLRGALSSLKGVLRGLSGLKDVPQRLFNSAKRFPDSVRDSSTHR